MTKSHSAPCFLDPSVSNHTKLPFLNEQSCSLSLISVLSFRIQRIRTIHTISTVWMCLFSAVFITFISNEKKKMIGLVNRKTVMIPPGDKDLSMVLRTTKVKKQNKSTALLHKFVIRSSLVWPSLFPKRFGLGHNCEYHFGARSSLVIGMKYFNTG